MQLNIKNETSKLKSVVLGQPYSIGKQPDLEETYDAKSYESVKNNVYPKEENIIQEMSCFEKALLKYEVEVLKPSIIPDYNQIFARDVAFAIDDKLIISNMIADRADEIEGYRAILNNIPVSNIYTPPKNVHVEGGDIILSNDVIFISASGEETFRSFKTARTNIYAIDYFKELFPEKTFIVLELKKNDTNPHKGVLHLDCTFMPIGTNKAIVSKEGFLHQKDYMQVIEYFGKDNIFEVTKDEVYYLYTNLFSISPNVVISEERFTRLNSFLEKEWGMIVEKVPYHEVSKLGGLFRCSTLPLYREYEK